MSKSVAKLKSECCHQEFYLFIYFFRDYKDKQDYKEAYQMDIKYLTELITANWAMCLGHNIHILRCR